MIDSLSLKKRANWIFVIGWMILIFAFSGQTAEDSSALSGGIVDVVAKCIQPFLNFTGLDNKEIALNMLTFLIRKTAHAFLYFVLGILVYRALSPENEVDQKAFFFAFGIAVLYACSDELHQLFLEGRSGELRDVLIDACGALSGLLVYVNLFCKRWQRKKV